MEQATSSFAELLATLRQGLDAAYQDCDALQHVERPLESIRQAASDVSRPDLASVVDLVGQLVSVAESIYGESGITEDARQIIDFCHRGVDCIAHGIDDEAGAAAWMNQLREEAQEQWGDCLDLLQSASSGDMVNDAWMGDPIVVDDRDELADEALKDAVNQVGKLLSSLGQQAPLTDGRDETIRQNVHESNASLLREEASEEDDDLTFDPHLPSGSRQQGSTEMPESLHDPEIREAFLDDARCGLSAIEGALLTYESDPNNRQPLHQVCRELHTIKGASASVGLAELAGFLHRVEDDLQTACNREGAVELDGIFKALDAVRAQMEQCHPRGGGEATSAGSGAVNATRTPATERFIDTSTSQESVRVKSAQLDRLMDMLAELVMLRNRRESRMEELKTVHSELVRCVSRLRAYEENYSTATVISATHQITAGEHAAARPHPVKQRVSSLTEIANDLLELGNGLRELYEPIGDENHAISRFIRNFRQELIQLRRVPIRGLFQRLQRAARDAARSEGKQVRVELIGEDVGLESTLQQHLYEPLMHVVRNAVSHGVESEDQRMAAGKSSAGVVTIEAQGSLNLLAVTVRDDGGGLDYDALRRRGLEKGLISPDRPASRSELARLIFHPGFSTRLVTNEVSGRGVGMDVVAAAVERMHGWIEIDSNTGHGTSIRLMIPLQSVIEHVMVFRVGGQEFAVPTQFVHFAGSPRTIDTSEFPLMHLANLFPGIVPRVGSTPQLLVLACRGQGDEAAGSSAVIEGQTEPLGRRVGLLIDEIVGPEEVVVRPLPNLITQHPVFSGVSLSGTGDIMLLFEAQKLLERSWTLVHDGDVPQDLDLSFEEPNSRDVPRVLVVDDSRSSRRVLSRCLAKHGFEIEEAADGVDALRRLKEVSFDMIFTDLEMPQMGGMELLRDARAMTRTAKTPIIIVSSRGEDCFRQQARELGVTDYLTKPVSDAVVTQSLERHFRPLERTTR